jgi:hypothetical protein
VSAPHAAVGVGQAILTWTCVITNVSCSGGSAVSSFKVVTTPAVAIPTVPASSSGSGNYSVTITPLAPMTTYTMTIEACNANGCQATPTSVGSVSTPGQPTFTSAPTASGNGLTGVVAFGFNANGATVTGCTTTINGVGSAGGCGGASIPGLPTYNSPYSGTVTVSSSGFPDVTASFSFYAGLKTMTADASGAFGNCTSPGVPAYCGSSSHSCPSPSPLWANPPCINLVNGGTTLYADSCTIGSTDTGNGGNSSNVWVHIPGLGSWPWMNEMFLDGGNWQSAHANLPGC